MGAGSAGLGEVVVRRRSSPAPVQFIWAGAVSGVGWIFGSCGPEVGGGLKDLR